MAFKADEVVKALEYNFAPHVDAKGCTPEPSAEAVRHFLYETNRLAMELSGEDEESESFVEKMKSITEDDYALVAEQVLDLLAELTQGQPSRDEIEALPHRIQRAYTQWLREELTNPEAPSVATKGSLKGRPGGARSTTRGGS